MNWHGGWQNRWNDGDADDEILGLVAIKESNRSIINDEKRVDDFHVHVIRRPRITAGCGNEAYGA